jgi:hypothetical protein
MFIHEYYAYSEKLNEEKLLDCTTRLAAEELTSELNAQGDSGWLVVVRVNQVVG